MSQHQPTTSTWKALPLGLLLAGLGLIPMAGCVARQAPPCCREADSTHVPSDTSLYQLESTWVSDTHTRVQLGAFQGRPLVLAMFFASCEYACPIIVHDMKRIQEALPPALRHNVNFTLVSFDPQRDTAGSLHIYRERHRLGADHWSLLSGQSDDVRELAAVLGVNYQQDARGQFAHSNVITVLNPAGEIVYQQVGLNGDVLTAVQAIEAAANSN